MTAGRTMRAATAVASGLAILLAVATPVTAAPDEVASFDEVVADVLDLPYDPAAVPTGTDAAFGDDDYPAAFPLTDTSTGTCCSFANSCSSRSCWRSVSRSAPVCSVRWAV